MRIQKASRSPFWTQHGQQRDTDWPEVLEADVEVLNLLEEVTEEGGVATSVSQEPRSGSASTKGEKVSMAETFDK